MGHANNPSNARVKALLDSLAQDLSRTNYAIAVHVGSADTLNKLQWLKAQGRDFTAVSPQMKTAATNAARTVLERQVHADRVNFTQVVQAIGERVWAHVLLRFAGQRDVMMRALTRRTIDRKRRAGRPTTIGIDTGEMLRDMGNATVRARRR